MDNNVPVQILEICQGKYRLVHNSETGEFEAYRYNRKWRDLAGDKLIYALFVEITELCKEVIELREKEYNYVCADTKDGINPKLRELIADHPYEKFCDKTKLAVDLVKQQLDLPLSATDDFILGTQWTLMNVTEMIGESNPLGQSIMIYALGILCSYADRVKESPEWEIE